MLMKRLFSNLTSFSAAQTGPLLRIRAFLRNMGCPDDEAWLLSSSEE